MKLRREPRAEPYIVRADGWSSFSEVYSRRGHTWKRVWYWSRP